MLNILPVKIAEELKNEGKSEARSLENVTVMFTDFVNFTKYAESMKPSELVAVLHECFTAFDGIVAKYKIEKIKSIGDGYMAVGGINGKIDESAANVVRAALEMQQFIFRRQKIIGENNKASFHMRVGINSGNVVAGIVGVKKFQYDIWGDTVNTASRMESFGELGKVNISQSTYALVKNNPEFNFEYRGKIEVKSKGDMNMWFVNY